MLRLAAAGSTNSAIGEHLGLSVHAVKFHLASVYRKLGVANRTRLRPRYSASALDVPLRRVNLSHGSSPVLPGHRALLASGLGGPFGCVTLAFFSFLKLGPHGITYRQQETWQASGTLYVTQPGFPEGRLTWVQVRREWDSAADCQPLHGLVAACKPLRSSTRRSRTVTP